MAKNQALSSGETETARVKMVCTQRSGVYGPRTGESRESRESLQNVKIQLHESSIFGDSDS